MTALIRRSRSSTRWATKGCSVPASSSSGGVWDMQSVELLRAVARHAGCARQRAGAHAIARLVPLRRGALFQAPFLLGMAVLGEHRLGGRRGECVRVVEAGGPLLLEVGGTRAH